MRLIIISLMTILSVAFVACNKKQESAPPPCAAAGVNQKDCSLEVTERTNWSQSLQTTSQSQKEKDSGISGTKREITVTYAFEKVEPDAVWKRALTIKTNDSKIHTTIEGGRVEKVTADEIHLSLSTDSCSTEEKNEKIVIKYLRNGSVLEMNPKDNKINSLSDVLVSVFSEVFAEGFESFFKHAFSYLNADVYLNNPSGPFQLSQWPESFGQVGCFTLGRGLSPFRNSREKMEMLTEYPVFFLFDGKMENLTKDIERLDRKQTSRASDFYNLSIAKQKTLLSLEAFSEMYARVNGLAKAKVESIQVGSSSDVMEDILETNFAIIQTTQGLALDPTDPDFVNRNHELEERLIDAQKATRFWGRKINPDEEALLLVEQSVFDNFYLAFSGRIPEGIIAQPLNFEPWASQASGYGQAMVYSVESVRIIKGLLEKLDPEVASNFENQLSTIDRTQPDLELLIQLEELKAKGLNQWAQLYSVKQSL